MDKMLFLATLAGKLSEYPMSAEDIEKSIASVKVLLDRISDVDFAAEPPSEQDAADMAKDLYEKYMASKETQEQVSEVSAPAETALPEQAPIAAETPVAAEILTDTEIPAATEISEVVCTVNEPEIPDEPIPPVQEYVPDETSYMASNEPPAPEEILEQLKIEDAPVNTAITTDDEFFEMLAKEAETERVDQARIEELELKALAMANKEEPELVAQVLSQDEKLVEIVAQSDIADEFDPIEGAFDPAERPDIAFEESELTKAFATGDINASREFKIKSDKLKKVDESESKPRKIKKEPREKVKGSPLFWTLFILTLPITIPLMAIVYALFGIAYATVTVLIIALAASMLVVIGGGTALSLIGIIYGIIECFSKVPIGLYEIGLGIIIGGVTMLISVLLKNISMNYTPKLYKLIKRFGEYVFGSIADLYIKIKKECGKK